MLLHSVRSCAGEAALRLFACACVREIEGLIKDDNCLWAVGVAERFAEGNAGQADLALAAGVAERSAREKPRTAKFAAVATTRASAWDAAWDASWEAALAAGPSHEFNRIREHQAGLLRAIVEPPDRPAINPAWLAWNDRCVVALAREIRKERRFADLPVLADALEDAGCDDPALLCCRVRAARLRMCWVVDRILEIA
jgi:hypothetical protein